jgi:hypothetical protein
VPDLLDMPASRATERQPVGQRKQSEGKGGGKASGGRTPPTPPADEPRKRVQHNVGLDPETSGRVSGVADALGLDEVQLIRMMIKENLPVYERRAAAVRAGRPADLN